LIIFSNDFHVASAPKKPIPVLAFQAAISVT